MAHHPPVSRALPQAAVSVSLLPTLGVHASTDDVAPTDEDASLARDILPRLLSRFPSASAGVDLTFLGRMLSHERKLFRIIAVNSVWAPVDLGVAYSDGAGAEARTSAAVVAAADEAAREARALELAQVLLTSLQAIWQNTGLIEMEKLHNLAVLDLGGGRQLRLVLGEFGIANADRIVSAFLGECVRLQQEAGVSVEAAERIGGEGQAEEKKKGEEEVAWEVTWSIRVDTPCRLRALTLPLMLRSGGTAEGFMASAPSSTARCVTVQAWRGPVPRHRAVAFEYN